MVKLRKGQILALRKVTTRKQLEESAEYIYRKINEATPEAVSEYSYDDAISAVTKVIEAARRYGIVDLADVAQWAYLRLMTKVDFYDAPAFKYFLDEPLLHPARKAKAVVEAYTLAAELERR